MENNKALVWFRNDLRVNDQHSLAKACSENDEVFALYCFDPRQFAQTKYGFKKTERFRAKFLLETVAEFRENLLEKNISMLVYYDTPENVFPQVISDNNISKIYCQKEWTSEEQNVLDSLKKLLPSTEFIETYDQFLFHPGDLPHSSLQDIPNVFTKFRNVVEKDFKIRPLVSIEKKSKSNLLSTINQMPSLQTLGFEDFEIDSRTAFPFSGGENQALKRIEDYFWKTKNLSIYKETRNGLIGTDYSSKLSAWLSNGSISPRTIYWEIQKYEKEVDKNDSTYWLIFELLWRDYFKFISLKYGSKIFKISGILEKEYDWNFDQQIFEDWTNGKMNEPFVNANMLEIKNTGWMSNRGRQNVGSYWSKELEQNWLIAATYFESMLVDCDVHSNYCNWMYVSGVGNDPRSRKFNISRQAEMYDKDGHFRKLWNSKS